MSKTSKQSAYLGVLGKAPSSKAILSDATANLKVGTGSGDLSQTSRTTHGPVLDRSYVGVVDASTAGAVPSDSAADIQHGLVASGLPADLPLGLFGIEQIPVVRGRFALQLNDELLLTPLPGAVPTRLPVRLTRDEWDLALQIFRLLPFGRASMERRVLDSVVVIARGPGSGAWSPSDANRREILRELLNSSSSSASLDVTKLAVAFAQAQSNSEPTTGLSFVISLMFAILLVGETPTEDAIP